MFGWLALIVAALAGLFVVLQKPADAGDTAVLLNAAVGIAAIFATFYFVSLKSSLSFSRRHGLSFFTLILCSIAGAVWWLGKDQIAAALLKSPSTDAVTPRGSAHAPVSVLIRRNPEGSFTAQGQISGSDAAFLIDTGASSVMLKKSDAERSGIDVQNLNFTTPVETANGTVYAAPVRVRSISIGLLKVDDVEALVAQPGSLNENLLGISFLRRLTSYDMSGDFLTLRN
jgi:aspartyl protease family protein